MKIISIIKDHSIENSDTYSVLTEIQVNEFRCMLKEHEWLSIKDEETGQRKFITGTHKSKLIRVRLQKDIKNGAVLPPIVMGFVYNKEETRIDMDSPDSLKKLIEDNYKEIFILDGVQRCTNLYNLEAVDIKDTLLRIEWWITDKIDNALDRMLILNFAQNPWSLKQQSKAISLLFKKTDKNFNNFSQEFSKELEKEPHKFLECLFSFQKRKNNIFIKDEISSVFLQEHKTPVTSSLNQFAVTYTIASLWPEYLLAKHSTMIGICLAMADILEENKKSLDIEEESVRIVNKIFSWTENNVNVLGEFANDQDGNKQNYLDYQTLKSKYGEIKSVIAVTSREMFRIAFTEIFNNILNDKSCWTENVTDSEDGKIAIMEQFGGIWGAAYTQIGRDTE